MNPQTPATRIHSNPGMVRVLLFVKSGLSVRVASVIRRVIDFGVHRPTPKPLVALVWPVLWVGQTGVLPTQFDQFPCFKRCVQETCVVDIQRHMPVVSYPRWGGFNNDPRLS